MNPTRTYINVATFVALSIFLVVFGATQLVFNEAKGATLNAVFEDASGLLPDNDVTMRGVVVGSVESVSLNEEGYALVTMNVEPGTEVPEGTEAEIVRRSPIGELTLELVPGDGEPLASGSTIDVDDTTPPPDVSKTIEVFADILHEVPSEDLTTLVHEVATAVDGRAEDLARLSEAGADLPERMLEVKTALDSLIRTSPEVTGVLADNAEVLADDITQTALLADILRDRRYDLVKLYENGGEFAEVFGGMLEKDKANLACLIRDFGDINTVMAKSNNLENLASTLETNHHFFNAVELAVRKDRTKGWTWFRVQMLPHQEPAGRSYEPHRDPPDVLRPEACRTRYGAGVDAPQDRAVLAPESKVRND